MGWEFASNPGCYRELFLGAQCLREGLFESARTLSAPGVQVAQARELEDTTRTHLRMPSRTKQPPGWGGSPGKSALTAQGSQLPHRSLPARGSLSPENPAQNCIALPPDSPNPPEQFSLVAGVFARHRPTSTHTHPFFYPCLFFLLCFALQILNIIKSQHR